MAKKATTSKKTKATPAVYTDERGLKFKFKNTVPKTLNIDGVSRKLTDLIKDEEVMMELVNGNSNHIEQIF